MFSETPTKGTNFFLRLEDWDWDCFFLWRTGLLRVPIVDSGHQDKLFAREKPRAALPSGNAALSSGDQTGVTQLSGLTGLTLQSLKPSAQKDTDLFVQTLSLTLRLDIDDIIEGRVYDPAFKGIHGFEKD